MKEEIYSVEVWPPIIRLLHLLMAATVMILLLTGLLMSSGMILNEVFYQHLLTVWHLPSGHVLLAVIIVRLILLLVRRDVLGWKALMPDNMGDIIKVAMFYLSFARLQLPAYFAHNPLWKLLYLALYILLLVQAVTGLLLESAWLRSVFRTDSATALMQHQALLEIILVLVFMHILSSLLHDWKSPSAEISSIINGRKFFHVEKNNNLIPTDKSVSVSLDSLTGKSKSKDQP